MNLKVKAGLLTIAVLGLIVLLAMIFAYNPPIVAKVMGVIMGIFLGGVIIAMLYQICYNIVKAFSEK